MNVTVLGPQRQTETARAAVAELIPDHPVATINAGWREREEDSAELDAVLGGRMANLRLWQRWRSVQDDDPQYAAAERRLSELLAQQQRLYGLRLRHALAALTEVEQRGEIDAVREPAHADAVLAVQRLDAWHLDRVAGLREAFFDEVRLGERPIVRRHREEVAGRVASSAGFVITGGHVGALLQCLHVFNLGALLHPPVIAWSAGAMALAERIVLFNDDAPQGEQPAEVYAAGLGALRGHLAFPHPGRRLHLDDRQRMARLTDRFAPYRCLLLEPGARFDLVDDPGGDAHG